jgi:hypothetical protein
MLAKTGPETRSKTLHKLKTASICQNYVLTHKITTEELWSLLKRGVPSKPGHLYA